MCIHTYIYIYIYIYTYIYIYIYIIRTYSSQVLFAMIPGIFAGAPTEDTFSSPAEELERWVASRERWAIFLMGNPPFHGNPKGKIQVVGKQGVQHIDSIREQI